VSRGALVEAARGDRSFTDAIHAYEAGMIDYGFKAVRCAPWSKPRPTVPGSGFGRAPRSAPSTGDASATGDSVDRNAAAHRSEIRKTNTSAWLESHFAVAPHCEVAPVLEALFIDQRLDPCRENLRAYRQRDAFPSAVRSCDNHRGLLPVSRQH
jgi:hypothetical protein